jgi:hypothetical protein
MSPHILTRERALGAQAGGSARRVPTPLEVLAQQAIALEAQAHALVATVLQQLDAQQPRAEDPDPLQPPTFGTRHTEPTLREDAP